MRLALRAATVIVPLVAYLALGWVAGLAIMVAWAAVHTRDALRLRRALAPTLPCPRGHAVPQYGVHRCSACGAVTEGWLWECECGASAAHARCPDCGLSVWNPLVR